MNSNHPSRDILGSLGSELTGRTIVLCVSGSVAAVRAPDVARTLMRHGAEVIPVMSPAACDLIGPDLMHWATGRKPVLELTGRLEHVAIAGNVPEKADLIIVAPATANTIGKIACGIDDTPVTTVVTTGLGEGIPLIVVPAMHESMYNHPFVRENLQKLEQHDITVLMPRIAEGKAKIADSEHIFAAARDRLARQHMLAGHKVLITVGRTVEYLDPVRVITNNSSGKMGMALAAAARAIGAEVTVVYGKGSAVAPAGVRIISVDTAEDMRRSVWGELSSHEYAAVIAAAAVGDWKPLQRQDKKISTHSGRNQVIELEPTPKIIDGIKASFPQVLLVAFRAQHDLPREELIKDAVSRMRKAGADMIAVNDVSIEGAGFETDTNEMYLISSDEQVEHIPLTSKKRVGERIIAALAERLRRTRP